MAIATSQLAGASAMTALAANFQLGWPLGKTALFTFVVSMLLNKLWTIIIYPWFFNPLRHLPQPSVSIPYLSSQMKSHKTFSRVAL